MYITIIKIFLYWQNSVFLMMAAMALETCYTKHFNPSCKNVFIIFSYSVKCKSKKFKFKC